MGNSVIFVKIDNRNNIATRKKGIYVSLYFSIMFNRASVPSVMAEVLKVWLISAREVICSFLHFLMKNTVKPIIRGKIKKEIYIMQASK